MMTRRLAGWALLGSMVCGSLPAEAAGVALQTNSPSVTHVLGPGESTNGSIEVRNLSDVPLNVNAFLADFDYVGISGDRQFFPPGSVPRSASSWITFSPTNVEIPARGKILVEYVIRVPKDSALEGGYYAMLFYQGRPIDTSEAKAAGFNIGYTGSIGTVVKVEIKGTIRRYARLVGLTAARSTDGIRITGQVTNEGNVSLNCSGTFHIQDSGNLIAARGEMPNFTAGIRQQVPVDVEWRGRLQSGPHFLIVTYDCGEELLLAEEAEFSVP